MKTARHNKAEADVSFFFSASVTIFLVKTSTREAEAASQSECSLPELGQNGDRLCKVHANALLMEDGGWSFWARYELWARWPWMGGQCCGRHDRQTLYLMWSSALSYVSYFTGTLLANGEKHAKDFCLAVVENKSM